MTDEKCPRCKEGIIQRTALTPPSKGEAIGCNRCPYPLGEPGLSYDPLEVDEGWEPPYRNKNACFEQKLAKEIGEMSDEAVEVAVEKYFTYPLCDCSGLNHTKECPFTGSRYNPCEEINIGVNELHYNPMEVDEDWEPPKPSHPNELYRMCWDIVNELRDANKVYFVDEIPEEMVKVYDIADMMETWLLKNGSSGA